MIDAGISAILIKVAALGLEPTHHLGKSLETMQPILHKLNRLYNLQITYFYIPQHCLLQMSVLANCSDRRFPLEKSDVGNTSSLVM